MVFDLTLDELFGNPVPTGGSWIEQTALLMAVVWPILITVVFLPVGHQEVSTAVLVKRPARGRRLGAHRLSASG